MICPDGREDIPLGPLGIAVVIAVCALAGVVALATIGLA